MRDAETQLLQAQQEINGNIASIYSEDYKNLTLAAAKTPQPGCVITRSFSFSNLWQSAVLMVLRTDN